MMIEIVCNIIVSLTIGKNKSYLCKKNLFLIGLHIKNLAPFIFPFQKTNMTVGNASELSLAAGKNK